MKLSDFAHSKYKLIVNKKMLPINEISYSNYELWNEVYQYAKSNFTKVEPEPSLAFPNGRYRGVFRYMVAHINQSHELVFCCSSGCYRFIIQPSKKQGNTVSGRKSVLELYKIMDKYNIDMSKYACTNGIKIKQEISMPHIKLLSQAFSNKHLRHCYHLDFHSSYASRIVEAIPELREVYEELYYQRKENNDLFKHVLTNSIGCFQSPYCPDYKDRRKSNPYMFAELSKIAVNGTRRKVEEYIEKLNNAGMIPLLTNTDGIWYYSNKGPFHDEDEGEGLCKWCNDHLDCDLLIASVGAYQYLENGVCHTVVRGTTTLDQIKSRTDWEFGDIYKINGKQYFYFDEEKGIVEDYE